MIVCEHCQSQMSKEWKCKCPTLSDLKLRALQPFIEKVNGWANFLAMVKTASEPQVMTELPKLAIRAEEPSGPVLEPKPAPELETLEEVVRAHILKVYEATGRNKMAAAKALGITAKTIYSKLELYGAHDAKGRVKK